MEKRNSLFIIILCLLVIGLGGYIVYDKVLDDNKSLFNNDNVADKISDDNNGDLFMNYIDLVSNLKEEFDIIYGAYSSPNTYCGKNSELSNKLSPNGGFYDLSTQFNSYDELYKYLSEYANSDVLSTMSKINKQHYLEEDGKLYCANLGKGGIYTLDNILFEYTEMTGESIKGTASVILTTDMNCIGVENPSYDCTTYSIEKYDVVFTKNNQNWIISSFNVVK